MAGYPTNDHPMTRTMCFNAHGSPTGDRPHDMTVPPTGKGIATNHERPDSGTIPVYAIWDDFFDQPGIDLPDRDQPPPQTRVDRPGPQDWLAET